MSNKVKKKNNTIWEATLLVSLIRRVYEVRRFDGLWWHDIHTKLHENPLGHWNNINVITSTNLEAAMLVLLMGRIYEVRHWDRLRCHDIHTKFHKYRFRR
jgi:hypothetical protein